MKWESVLIENEYNSLYFSKTIWDYGEKDLPSKLQFLFLLSSVWVEESIGFVQIFDFWFLVNLHALGCPEHGLTIFGKCLSASMCDKNFVASVAQELMNRISWNSIFSITLT